MEALNMGNELSNEPPLQYLRASGRTTRMLEAAIQEAEAGRAVYVIAADSRQKVMLEHRLDQLLKMKIPRRKGEQPLHGERMGIQFDTPESAANFSWETLRLMGMHPNCVVLVDHYAIEERFKKILETLHRFDS